MTRQIQACHQRVVPDVNRVCHCYPFQLYASCTTGPKAKPGPKGPSRALTHAIVAMKQRNAQSRRAIMADLPRAGILAFTRARATRIVRWPQGRASPACRCSTAELESRQPMTSMFFQPGLCHRARFAPRPCGIEKSQTSLTDELGVMLKNSKQPHVLTCTSGHGRQAHTFFAPTHAVPDLG